MSDETHPSDSRSDRLRRRRSERQSSGDPTSGEASAAESEPSKPSEPSKSTVKEEQVGTYMYLPESQKKDLERLYNVLKAEYEYEYDLEFEKNRHFYPLVIDQGLDGLDSLDASEIHALLQSL